MNKFQRATFEPEEMQRNIDQFVRDWIANKGGVRSLDPTIVTPDGAREKVTASYKDIRDNERVWLNDKYQVTIRDVGSPAEGWPPMWHLSIKHRDRTPCHDWRELQQIKNELIGPEHEGCEIYPAESRKVDTSNQYHAWVFKNAEARWPFGFPTRCVVEEPGGKAVQRPFEKEAV